MDADEAQDYLRSLLNQNLRIATSDGRLFWGAFKCTDANQNVVLAHTYEYRPPCAESVRRRREEELRSAAAAAAAPEATVKVDMTSRYLGLVVVPGHHIVKMELEQFVSQMRK